jgi:hypothetical protein
VSARRVLPIWPRFIRCIACGARPRRHHGQREGIRRYFCTCGHGWAVAPKGWHTVDRFGIEGMEIDEVAQNGHVGVAPATLSP